MAGSPGIEEGRALFVSAAPRLRSYAHVLLGNLDDGEDVLQETFVKFLQQGPDPRDPGVQGWLWVAFRHEALNFLRGKRRRRQREEARGPLALADPLPPPERVESLEKIKSCLMKLPADLREMVYLKVVEDHSFSQVAEILKVPRSTAALRVQEGLILLNRCYHGEPA